MQISALQPKVDASHVALESLAGNKSLSQDQKIAEASRQFESLMIRQFLSESQKPAINSEFTDNSNEAGIYQDMITNQLADSLSRGGGIGLAATFERQLTPHTQSAGGGAKGAGNSVAGTGTPGNSHAASTLPNPTVSPAVSTLPLFRGQDAHLISNRAQPVPSKNSHT